MISVQSFWKSGIYVGRDRVFLMDIEKLIEQGKQGDDVALGSLYRAYHQRMTEICQRIVGDQCVAEELAHDAFLLAFAKMDSLRNPQRFESWLTSITTNVALRYKERHREPAMLSLSSLTEKELAADTTPAIEKPLPTMTELMKAVDALPNGYGQVFKLSVIQGMSHKEIAEIMGIAAHSSSSQLARAKKMLQRSLAHYWLLWLLPLLLPITYIFLKTDKQFEESPTPVTTKQENIVSHPAEPTKPSEKTPIAPDIHRGVPRSIAVVPVTHQPNDSMKKSDTILHNVEQSDTSDIIRDEKPLSSMHRNNDIHIADLLPDNPEHVKDNSQKLSVDLAYMGSLSSQDYNRPFTFTEIPQVDATTDLPSPQTFDNWSDYASFLSSILVDGDFQRQKILMQIAQNNANKPGSDKIERKTHYYMPVTLSLALKYKLSNRFGIETGLSYSRLKSESEIGTGRDAIREQQAIHYVGIPLKGAYHFYNGKQWNIYGSLGTMLEIPVYAPLTTNYYLNGEVGLSDKTTLNAPLQWSVGSGLGLQFNLTPNLGFFVEPGLQYYIPTGSSIETYRTEHPFTFSVPLGIRITW